MNGLVRSLVVVAAVLPLTAGALAGMSVQATLLDANGNGLDGDFDLKFTMYDAALGGNELWTETHTTVLAVKGFFDVVLGVDGLNPILPDLFVDNSQVFVAIQVLAGPGVPAGGDPELERRPMTKVGAAFIADIATEAITLGGFTADDFLKKGEGLGLPVNQEDLPGNGLNEVSNGLLTNQFVDEVASSSSPITVGSGVIDTLNFPDIGQAESLTVSVDISTTGDLSNVVMKLVDPELTQYTLFENSADNTFVATFPDPDSTVTGDLTTWVGKNPKGQWTVQVIDSALNPGATINSWSVKIQTLSNKKVGVNGNLIVDGTITGVGGTTIDGDLTVNGGASFADGATISGNVTFSGLVDFQNSWCPDRPDGKPSIVVGGVCLAHIFGNRSYQSAAVECANIRADLCTDSQSQVLRGHGLLKSDQSGTTNANWTNSYSGDDGGHFRDAVGTSGDDHGPGNGYSAPCCYNNAPARSTDVTVGNSVRLIHVHDSADTHWGFASAFCTRLNADLCSKAQYQVLRDNGVVNAPMWANDHSDNDGSVCNSSIGSVPDDPNPGNNLGFACCATSNKAEGSTECPPEFTFSGGVCATKTGVGTWNSAVNDCDSSGAQLCSISQTHALRNSGVLGSGGTAHWTNSHSDNDGGHLNPVIGNVSDNPTNGQQFNYACCL